MLPRYSVPRSAWRTPAMELVNYQTTERVVLTGQRGTVRLHWCCGCSHSDAYAPCWLEPHQPPTGALTTTPDRYLGEITDTGADHDEADRRFVAVLGTERADMGRVYSLNTDDFFEAVAFLAGDPNDWHQYPDGRYCCWADMREAYFISERTVQEAGQ